MSSIAGHLIAVGLMTFIVSTIGLSSFVGVAVCSDGWHSMSIGNRSACSLAWGAWADWVMAAETESSFRCMARPTSKAKSGQTGSKHVGVIAWSGDADPALGDLVRHTPDMSAAMCLTWGVSKASMCGRHTSYLPWSESGQ